MKKEQKKVVESGRIRDRMIENLHKTIVFTSSFFLNVNEKLVQNVDVIFLLRMPPPPGRLLCMPKWDPRFRFCH